MIITILNRRICGASLLNKCFLLLLLLASSVQAQYTLNVETIHETCDGNGGFNLSVENAQPGATIIYEVYLLPNTTTPIWNSTDATVDGQQAGTYLIEAQQMVGGEPFGAPASQEATINEEYIPLEYSADTVNAECGADGTITINVSQGSPVLYKITSGPIDPPPPPQTSNVFNNLPAGSYQFIVTDECGVSVPQFITLGSDGAVVEILMPPTFPDAMLPACDKTTVVVTLMPATDVLLTYPITAVFTVFPPDGSDPIVYSQVVASDPTPIEDPSVPIGQVIDLFYGENYNCQVEITDACGYTLPAETFPVTETFRATATYGRLECEDYYITITPVKYVLPVEIEFTEVPDGIDIEDMADFNAAHPGPFFEAPVEYGGEGNSLPLGEYSFIITDGCGRTYTYEDLIIEEPEEIEPVVDTYAAVCESGTGSVQITIPGFMIESAEVTLAPEDYPYPLPHESVGDPATIDDDTGELIYEGLIPGFYKMTIVDECGHSYEVEFTIEGMNPAEWNNSSKRPGCRPGFNSIRLGVNLQQDLTEVIIIDAPAEFEEALGVDLPFDASAYIVAGYFYMADMPPGDYVFDGVASCTPDLEEFEVTIEEGYEETVNDHSIIPHCGSFDLNVNHTSNGTDFMSFWLQKWDPAALAWTDPDSGTVYVEETELDDDNAFELDNNTINLNLVFPTGEYRIIKMFRSFLNGTEGGGYKLCFSPLFEFEYDNTLIVNGAASVSCSGNSGDVIINAQGVELTYAITAIDGEDTFIDNGTSNIFTGLGSALYEVTVTSGCGAEWPFTFSIANLPSTVTAPAPEELETLELCDISNNGTEEFDLSVQEADITGTQNPDNIQITYHATEANAESGASPLPELYTTGSATIYVRVTYLPNPECFATTSFEVAVRPNPVLDMPTHWGMCEGEEVTITADPGYEKYTWSTGAQTQSITVDTTGIYTLTVQDAFGCETTQDIEVEVSSGPEITHVDVVDWTYFQNSITVHTAPNPSSENFEYSLDGENFQSSPIFSNLDSGIYHIYVRDVYGCGFDEYETYILSYPKFFTPNGDGINETWRIKYASLLEPDMLIYIYDRYGKLITGFGANHPGWDGTLNGYKLPSTDYWFVVVRQDGKEYKGHFSMLR